jgi:hypothetical protein
VTISKAAIEERTRLIEDAIDLLHELRGFPELPDIEGRITERGSRTLDRIADGFDKLIGALEK